MSNPYGTLEHQLNQYLEQEAVEQEDYDNRLHDLQQGMPDLILLPEADPNDIDSYMVWPPQYKPSIEYCSHGHLIWPGEKTGMIYHDNEDGTWGLCSDDPNYENFAQKGGQTVIPASF